MNWRFKLSKRLSLLKGIIVAAALSACVTDRPDFIAPDGPAAGAAAVRVSPNADSAIVGETMQFTATVLDSNGHALSEPVTWESADTAIAVVNSNGTVTTVAPGASLVFAWRGRWRDSARVKVTPPAVSTVTVTPSTNTVGIGYTAQLSATLKDAAGNTLSGRTIAWTTANAAIATVSSSGLVSAFGVGYVIITATSEGKSGTAMVYGAAPTPPPVVPVASITLSPATNALQVGGTAQLTATLRDASNNILTGRTISWTSSAAGVATVSSSGLITAAAAGSATITATSEGRSATASVTATAAVIPVASVLVTPATSTIGTGYSAQLSAATRDAAGNTLTGRPVSWTSSNAAIATVSNGLVSAVGIGSVTITATSEGVSGTASVYGAAPTPPPAAPVASVSLSPATNALLVGGTAQLTATLRDSANNVLTGRTITWSTSAAAIATVSSSGLITAVAAGSATMTATSEGRSATASVAVTAAAVPVASVTVTPATSTIGTGFTAQLSAAVSDAAGNALTGRVVSWTSSNAAIATVSSNGLVSAVGIGNVTITATSEGVSGTAAVTGAAPTPPPAVPVATVSLSPATNALLVGGTAQLTATLRDAANNVLTGRTISWTSSAAGVATVSSSGLITAVAAGSATITATSEGRSATASVTVTAPPPVSVASITLSPATNALLVGGTGQLTATLRDSANNVLTGRTIAWTSSAAAVATVSSNGLVTAVAAGSATITASSGGRSGTASVTVTIPPPVSVASITVSPSSSALLILGTLQLTATLRDSANNILTGRTVTWSTSGALVATVNVNGLVAAVALGNVTITASSGGRSGTSSITVNPAAPPPPPPPPSGGSNAEPVDPGSGYLWADNFDRYPSLAATGACNANTVFGQHTQYNTGNCASAPGGQYAFIAGRNGTGNALRGIIANSPGTQQSVTWLTPWPAGFATYSQRGIVMQFWFRSSPGGTPGVAGTKWIEVWNAAGSQRVQWGLDGGGPRWAGVLGSNPGGTINRTQSSASWTSYNDGQWHRATHLFLANTSTTYSHVSGNSSSNDVYSGSSSRDGRIAMWIDGQLILDYQQSKVGQSCTQSDVDFIPVLRGSFLKLPDVFNGSPTAWTLDHDDLKVWTTN